MDDGQTPSQDQPSAGGAPGTSPVTEAALASIVEIRQPIRPEFARGGLVALIPSFLIAFLVVVLAVGVLALVGNLLPGAINPFAPSGLSPVNPPSFPGFPNPRR
jgi:hypothetical protein